MPTSIFVSYSHQDAGLVTPVVGLLRATKDIVFHDLDSIKPGRKWRGEIAEALSTTTLIILFWCYHSSRSREVRKEYQFALTTNKAVLPVLLDATPVPAPLDEFQWVDFRHLAISGHRSRKRWSILAALAVLVMLLVAGFLILLPNQYTPPSSSPQPRIGRPPAEDDRELRRELAELELRQQILRWQLERSPRGSDEEAALRQQLVALEVRRIQLELELLAPRYVPPSPPEAETHVFWFILLALCLVLVVVLITSRVWKARRLRIRATPTDFQQHMADQIRDEIFRRGIGLA